MEKIYDAELPIVKIDEKNHKKIKFNIEKVAKQLRIEFEYFPRIVLEKKHIIEAFKDDTDEMTLEEAKYFKEKYLNRVEELKNLITISLYYEGEYIGCGHRGLDKQKIIISQEESTPGFKNTIVHSGEWKIILSMHGVNTNMKTSLKVYAEY